MSMKNTITCPANLQHGLERDGKSNGRSKEKQQICLKTVSTIISLCRENQVKARSKIQTTKFSLWLPVSK